MFSPITATDYTLPVPFVFSASSEYPSIGLAWIPFSTASGGTAIGWIGTNGGVDWNKLDIGAGNSKILSDYKITGSTGPVTRSPKNWTMEGSNDNSTWDVLDTRTNETSWAPTEQRSYVCSVATTAYRYFRFNVSANNGDATYTGVENIGYYSVVPTGFIRHRITGSD